MGKDTKKYKIKYSKKDRKEKNNALPREELGPYDGGGNKKAEIAKRQQEGIKRRQTIAKQNSEEREQISRFKELSTKGSNQIIEKTYEKIDKARNDLRKFRKTIFNQQVKYDVTREKVYDNYILQYGSDNIRTMYKDGKLRPEFEMSFADAVRSEIENNSVRGIYNAKQAYCSNIYTYLNTLKLITNQTDEQISKNERIYSEYVNKYGDYKLKMMYNGDSKYIKSLVKKKAIHIKGKQDLKNLYYTVRRDTLVKWVIKLLPQNIIVDKDIVHGCSIKQLRRLCSICVYNQSKYYEDIMAQAKQKYNNIFDEIGSMADYILHNGSAKVKSIYEYEHSEIFDKKTALVEELQFDLDIKADKCWVNAYSIGQLQKLYCISLYKQQQLKQKEEETKEEETNVKEYIEALGSDEAKAIYNNEEAGEDDKKKAIINELTVFPELGADESWTKYNTLVELEEIYCDEIIKRYINKFGSDKIKDIYSSEKTSEDDKKKAIVSELMSFPELGVDESWTKYNSLTELELVYFEQYKNIEQNKDIFKYGDEMEIDHLTEEQIQQHIKPQMESDTRGSSRKGSATLGDIADKQDTELIDLQQEHQRLEEKCEQQAATISVFNTILAVGLAIEDY